MMHHLAQQTQLQLPSQRRDSENEWLSDAHLVAVVKDLAQLKPREVMQAGSVVQQTIVLKAVQPQAADRQKGSDKYQAH